ncbi:hypothetical protein E3E12_08125 [Formicincola oecophyllae]|uniref:Uncharacterized protein n=1 Tax=Formicincola oecophyllae TaxID=2558361 RepID=A0A4Y6U9U3_9PROT|nr:hypothetical protein [Formicincola oecophyllae]QDH14162.1 hypothetical protein E3E12_08125 [Formicincola oecophyllae]
MRVWTRQWQPGGKRRWVATTGNQALIAWLQNALLLELGESPFHVDWGIPVTNSLVTRIWPTFYLEQTVGRFRDYFASLQVAPTAGADTENGPPDYTISAIFTDGTPYPSQASHFNQTFSQTGPSDGTY